MMPSHELHGTLSYTLKLWLTFADSFVEFTGTESQNNQICTSCVQHGDQTKQEALET